MNWVLTLCSVPVLAGPASPYHTGGTRLDASYVLAAKLQPPARVKRSVCHVSQIGALHV
jgi:hypothetical protein